MSVMVIVLIPLVIWAIAAIADRWTQAQVLGREAESLHRELMSARSENQRLQTRVTLARSDQSIEAIAREDLHLVRPGDTPVVLLVPTARATQSRPVVTVTPRPDR